MPQLASGFVQQKLLPRVDLVQLIGKYSVVKPSGSLFKCSCPLHQEKTPSCMIYPNSQHFKCFGCGSYGDALDFIMRYKHLTFMEGVNELAHFAGVEVEYEKPRDVSQQRQQQQWQQQQQRKQAYYDLMERVCQFFTMQLSDHPQALSYLQQRGLTAETIKTARLGYAPNDFGYLHAFCRSPNELQWCRELGLEIMKRSSDHAPAVPAAPSFHAFSPLPSFPTILAAPIVANTVIPAPASVPAMASSSSDSVVPHSQDHDSYAMFRDRIMIPLRDRQGHVIAFGARRLTNPAVSADAEAGATAADSPKYLNSRESALFKKHQELFGLYECLQHAPSQLPQIIVVEGYMDVLSLRQAGFNNVVAALGTAFSSEHFKLLQRYTSEIILCFDGDEAGRKAAWKALQVITPELRARCAIRVAYLPPEHDPDSLIRACGSQAFADYLHKSLSYPESIVLHEGERYGSKDPNQRIKLLSSVLSIIRAMPDAMVQEITLQTLSTYMHMDCTRLYALLDLSEPQPEFCSLSSSFQA